ncbi:TlpA family protein disulfide reductase [candidate division KSB1 bacterium]|nr:TlpA family protein disulfide reductase [candidate division KSB1 bacterium]
MQAQSQAQASEKRNVEQAYPFALRTLNGQNISLKGYQGKVLILNIWDTWCPPCKAEIPDFIEIYDTYRKKGVEILGVAGGRYGEKAVADFVEEYKINYPVAVGTMELFQGLGGVNAIPTTFVIDQQGNVYKKYVGYRDKSVFLQDIAALID